MNGSSFRRPGRGYSWIADWNSGAIATDPDGEDRILVKIPAIDNNAQGIWSRIACLDAGSDSGTFFRPEIDDEVIVGFINDDPNDAVVLGMLNSSAKKAPLQASDENHEKGIFTRSKMRIHFHDQTKTITIDTPAGNSIKLDEQGKTIEIKDQNSNKITLEHDGHQIEKPEEYRYKSRGESFLKSRGFSYYWRGITFCKSRWECEFRRSIAKLSASGITEIKWIISKNKLNQYAISSKNK